MITVREGRRRWTRCAAAAAATALCAALLTLPAAAPASADGSPAVPADPVGETYTVVGPAGAESVARCREGDYVVNGGWAAEQAEAALTKNWPSLDARGWEVAARAGRAYAFAVCMQLPGGGSTYTTEALSGKHSDRVCEEDWDSCPASFYATLGTATCSTGDRVIGGGWSTWADADAHNELYASYPSGSGEARDGSEPATGWTVGARGAARALCTPAGGPFGDVRVVTVNSTNAHLGRQTVLRANCPSGLALIGGGFSGAHDETVRNHPVAPAGWLTEQTAGTLTAKAVALCMPLGRGFAGAVVTPAAHVPSGGGTATAACPPGYRVFGGGYALDPHPTALNAGMWEHRPGYDGASWLIEAHHTGEVLGICLQPARSTATGVRVGTTPAYAAEPVTLIADVSARSGTPTGSVTFRTVGAVLGSATVDPDGEAWLHVENLPAGTHTVTATYEGGGGYLESSAAPVTFEVRPARAETTLVLSSSADPAPRGAPVTLTAAVQRADGAPAPTGSVTFYASGWEIGTARLGTDGVARLSHTFAEKGLHIVQAAYGGDDSNRGSAGRLRLLVTTLLDLGDLTIVESDVAPVTAPLRLSLSEPVQYDVPVHVAVHADAAGVLPDGASQTWDVVIPAGQVVAEVPVSVLAQPEQLDRDLAISVSTTANDVHVAQSTATGRVVVSHPTCTILGTEAADQLHGTSGGDVICGLGGDDAVSGAEGDDFVYGADGDDQLVGGAGADRLVGGRGADRLTASSGADALLGVDGVDGNDRLVGGPGATCESDPGDVRRNC